MTPALFHDLLLYVRDGSTTGNIISGRAGGAYRQLDLHCQLVHRITHRLAKMPQFLSTRPTFEGFADVSAEQPEIDVILFVDHRVLVMCKPGGPTTEERETDPDHDEKEGNSAKGGSCQPDTYDHLRKIDAVDGHIQHGENLNFPLRSFGVV